MKKIIYKGIEITEINRYYTFEFNGINFHNTNLRFTKVTINRLLKN
jgi:hypothetical protein